MRTHSLFVLFVALVLSASGHSQNPGAVKTVIPGSGLQNLYFIDKGVYRSEQPTDADFKAMEKYGIREVLNLRNRHSDDDEATGTNLKLHRVKAKAHAIDDELLIEALRIIQNRKGPIVIHCRHGSDRTGAVCAMYRILFQGVSKEKAIQEMTEGGFGFHSIYKNIIRVIREADVERIKKELRIS